MTVLVLDQHEDSDWKELPDWVQKAATELGYTKKLWDKDKEPSLCEKDWKELNDSQQKAAQCLGYTNRLWDDDDADSSSESSCDGVHSSLAKEAKANPTVECSHPYDKWTIYCIQLYTVTKDYKFQIRDGMGIAMYANRHFAAHESVVRSPVGPSNHEQLFQAPPSSSDVLSPEREAFAKRFLEWHNTHWGGNREGAASTTASPIYEDFWNSPTTGSDYKSLPSADNLVYDIEIFEHEIVIVEFVPPPSNPNYMLPPERRFEILSYDEGLAGMDGEKDYSAEKMKRPPTLCASEGRSLEVPGHFSNHACGSSSSAYDFIHLDPCRINLLVVDKTQPSWIQNEIHQKRKAYEREVHEELKTRRTILPGEEITTDYIRWHWSNSNFVATSENLRTPIGYFFGTEQSTNNDEKDANQSWEWDELSPKVQWAGRVLGYTKEIWDDAKAKNPPVFERKWKHLTALERQAIIRLTGHTKETWDKRDKNKENKTENNEDDATTSSSSTATSVDELSWNELSDVRKGAATFLGYTKNTWDKDEELVEHDGVFHALRPEVRDAFAILGETEFTWEDTDNDDGEYGESEPWFYCECGSAECHSSREKGGFRGVKYLSLGEQKKLAPVCEPMIQQQLEWTFYQLKQQKDKGKMEE